MFGLNRMENDLLNLIDNFVMFPETRRISKTKENSVISPLMDLYEKEDNYIAIFDVPGVEKDDLDITLEKGILRVSGEIKKTEEDQGTLVFNGRSAKRYNSSVRLPQEIDQEKIEAKLKNGILTLTLAKSDYVRARKIKIE